MWMAAFYEKEITPRLGSDIPGYFNPRYAEDVLDRLYAKAVVMNDGKNEVAIIAVDALDLNGEMHDIATQRIYKRTGIVPENILISATHTHTGPPIAAREYRGIKQDMAYTAILNDLMADCVEIAQKRLGETDIKYAIGQENTISFIRNYKMKDGSIRTNPGINNPEILETVGEIDPDVSILFFEDENKAPMGAIINFACHLDCIGGSKLSGDFPSVLSNELKETYGKDFVSLFINGACGNINHINVHCKEGVSRPSNLYVHMGRKVADTVKKALVKAEYISDKTVGSLKETINLKRRTFDEGTLEEYRCIHKQNKETTESVSTSNAGGDAWKAKNARQILDMAAISHEPFPVYLQTLRIGDCYIYALPGEVFSQFGKYIKEHSPSRRNMVAELSNTGGLGYIPIRELLGSFSYEAQPTSNKVDIESGYILSEKAVEFATQLKGI